MKRVMLVVMALAALALGREPAFDAARALQDSLRQIPPRLRSQWLRERGMDTPFLQPSKSDSAGIRAVGRWSGGPAYDVDGRTAPSETLIALGRGSGVSLLRVWREDTLHSELLSDINAERLLNKVIVRDTLLYVGTNAGLETYDISDEHNPVRLSWIQTGLAGFDIKDTLAYVTWYDTFKIYSIANPASPYRVGWCRDSAADVSVVGNTAFLADRWGMYTVDVSNPSSPHRLGSWGSDIMSVAARNNLCYVSVGNPNVPEQIDFYVLDVTNPSSPQQIGHLADAGGFDIYLDDTVAFISGYSAVGRGFQEISIADSTHPRFIATCSTPGAYGVWASATGGMAMLANYTAGLLPVDVTNPSLPVFGNSLLAACWTDDIEAHGSHAFLANLGLKILDISVPSRPVEVGHVDTLGNATRSIAACDSFAFAEWRVVFNLVSIDVTNPVSPQLAGGCMVSNPTEDMALRDSFLYLAEDYRFQVVNVARPIEPQVVGTCNLQNHVYTVSLEGNYAYVTDYPAAKIDISDPTHPTVVEQIPCNAWSMVVRDTLAFFGGGSDGLRIWNVANLGAAHEVSSLVLPQQAFAVAVTDSLAYVGGPSAVFVVDIADPLQPRLVGSAPAPYYVWRLEYQSPYLYAACEDAGVVIYESLPVGIAEQAPVVRSKVRVTPGVSSGEVRVECGTAGTGRVTVTDPSGRIIIRETRQLPCIVGVQSLREGIYLVRVETATTAEMGKFVKVSNRR